MAGEFVKDEAGFFWLINIHSLKYVNIQINTREDMQHKHVDNIFQEESSKLSSELEIFYRDLERKEAVKLLNQIMKKYYES